MTTMDQLKIRQVAVLGAGVMGAQIAAHFANVGIVPILFDLAAKEGNVNALVEQSIKGLKKLHPSPLVTDKICNIIKPANYTDDIKLIEQCDLIIEAISERLEWKIDLYKKITPYVKSSAILATNTSGLSIHALSAELSDSIQERFLGVHFFNPPRYMKLIELIPHKTTNMQVVAKLESFLVTHLGKGIIYAKDTPNFIGNRVGIFSLLSTIYRAEQFNLPPDVVDSLTGTLIGRPKSATFRTLDMVGLDTFGHVVQQGLATDPWHELFKVPDWITSLVHKGYLGAKTKIGIYKKNKGEIQVIDKALNNYRPVQYKVNHEIEEILKITDSSEKFSKLQASSLPEAKFLWSIFCDLFHYCAYHCQDIANHLHDIDLALRWGYGWEYGPFEIWQQAGWQAIANELNNKINAQQMLANVALPKWVFEQDVNQPQLELNSVYNRQYFPDVIINQQPCEGQTIFETDTLRLWTLDKQVAIASFKTKGNTISFGVITSLDEAIKIAENKYKALILWQRHGKDFSYGANLHEFLTAANSNSYAMLANAIHRFQQVALALRFSSIPTVAAVRGLVLGGACEFILHTDRCVAALESYIGLVETGVGVIPAGAGSKEMAKRAGIAGVERTFMNIAQAKLSTSAMEAKELGFLREVDTIIANADEILYVAHKVAHNLSEACYKPSIQEMFPVAGKNGIANIQAKLVNMRAGNFISEHDYTIALSLARVMCGGELDQQTQVHDQWILNLEQEMFIELVKTQQTQNRIEHMLATGKPLRN